MSRPGDSPQGVSTILLDITLCYRSIGRRPDGILRTERCLALNALDAPDATIDFCRYHRRSGRFYRVPRKDVAFIASYQQRRHKAARGSLRRLAGEVVEMLTSSDVRRYRFLRWDIRRLFPLRTLSRRLDPSAIAPNSIYALAGLAFDTHDETAIAELKRSAGISVFLLCYDIVPIVHPEYYQLPAVRDRCKRFFEAALRFADRIGVISDATRRDVEAFAEAEKTPLPPIGLVRLGTELGTPAPTARPAGLPELAAGSFVLCVGNLNIRKNHQLLYQLWARLAQSRPQARPLLVFAGSIGWKVEDLVERIRGDARTRGAILILTDVNDCGLSWLYANCLFTLYPSLYEGWGLPVSESLGHGKYCITSSTSSMPEAAAGLAATLNPGDVEAWEAVVLELLDDRQKLERLERVIRQAYKPVTWRAAADGFFQEVRQTAPAEETANRR